MSANSAAFERYHPKLQRWIVRQGWPELRTIQERAAAPIFAADADVILAAATAGGKTEAAFLPVLTSLAGDPPRESLGTLCVSPLKALINDQFERLEELGGQVDVGVHRWHGDVSGARKKVVFESPAGLLIITPESLEALFVRHGPRLPKLLCQLRYVVIDELHAFIGTERGRQLQSLLHRVELAIRRRVPRVALSATLGDMSLAAEFLRPGAGDKVVIIEDRESGQEVKLQIRGYRQRAGLEGPGAEAADDSNDRWGDAVEISRDLFSRLRGGHHLIFANRRAAVEQYADLLRRLCEKHGVPNEFWPHHGSLSKELREDAERAINDRSRPTSLIATTTLELGIDVGAIESIAQIGTPPSVAALRQRLGRSGRQGGPAVLRIAVQEPEVSPRTPLPDALHQELVQTIAMVELLVEGWVEPPPSPALHLSTLVQQILSVIAQHGGANAKDLWTALCGSGPFSTVPQDLFARLLRRLGATELLTQDHAGELSLGVQGEHIVDHYSFYAAFSTPEEYRLMCGGTTLGYLPISQALFPGLLLIFAGRRWRILQVDEEHKVVDLTVAAGGRTPGFVGAGGPLVHDKVRQKMLELYSCDHEPRYLDRTARDLLSEARSWFRRFDLGHCMLVSEGDRTLLFPWCGDRAIGTLSLLLGQSNLEVSIGGFVLEIERCDREKLVDVLQAIVGRPWPSAFDLAATAANRRTEKFHPHLDDHLLTADYAACRLDLPTALAAAQRAVQVRG